MGYTTYFTDKLKFDKPLHKGEINYIKAFNATRRMKRKAIAAKKLNDPLREAVNLPIGVEGGNFVGGAGFMGQDKDNSVVDCNKPPKGQPGLWCQWVVTDDGKYLEWDGGEKFYSYVEWLRYMITTFFQPWGYILNGEIKWQGEESDDCGTISVIDNDVTEIHTKEQIKNNSIDSAIVGLKELWQTKFNEDMSFKKELELNDFLTYFFSK